MNLWIRALWLLSIFFITSMPIPSHRLRTGFTFSHKTMELLDLPCFDVSSHSYPMWLKLGWQLYFLSTHEPMTQVWPKILLYLPGNHDWAIGWALDSNRANQSLPGTDTWTLVGARESTFFLSREQVNLGLAVTIFTGSQICRCEPSTDSETICRIQTSRNGKIKVPAMVSPTSCLVPCSCRFSLNLVCYLPGYKQLILFIA